MPKNEKKTAQAEKTLLSALLLSSPGPIVTGMSVLMSLNLTQFADFLRRSTELLAVFVSWWVYRKLKKTEASLSEQKRLEDLSQNVVQKSMIFSGSILLLLALLRIKNYKAGGNVSVGLVIAFLGLLTNGYFWLKYRSMKDEDSFAGVLTAQARLYQAKTAVDFCVVIALGAVWFAPFHPLTKIIDLSSSLLISLYLIYNGFKS